MATYGQITSCYGPAMLIGGVLLLTLVTTIAAVMREYRLRGKEAAPEPTASLSPIAVGHDCEPLAVSEVDREALIVRQRLSGKIDAETYQARMNDLARQAILERRPQRNA